MTERFINWRMEQRDGKPTKVPFDPTTGNRIDPLDPKNWRTRAEAEKLGHPIGEVLTADDPFAVIDIDDCFDPATGQWDERAQRVFGMVGPNPVWKLSQSRRGAHVKIRVDKAATATLRKRTDQYEVYSEGRFIAWGDMEWTEGDLTADRTDIVRAIMPPLEQAAPVAAVSGRDPGWSGPEDDETLLQRALASRPSMAAQFDGGITFAQLWHAEPEALAKAYPDTGTRGWDQSRADSALLAMLAFWTGRDRARMTRMYLSSPLAAHQPKRDRTDYLERSVGAAAMVPKRVYVDPRAGETNEAGSAPAGREYLSVPETIEHLGRFCYVADRHMVLDVDGELLKPDVFDALYGGSMFAMSWDNARPVDSAFKALTRNRAHQFPKARTTRFDPGAPFGEVVDGAVNVYVPHHPVTRPGDCGPFLAWLEKFLPVEQDRAILLAWMAAAAQNPGSKFLWAPVMQGTKGNGKSMIGRIVRYCIGDRYHFPVDPKKIDKQFNDFMENKILLTVEEIHMDNRRSALDTLKPLISEPIIALESKRQAQRAVENRANWIFTTNYKNAVIKERDDRRFAVFFSGQQSRADLERDGWGGDFFPSLWDWFNDGGYAHVAHMLLDMAIPVDLNPALDRGGRAKWAPDTSSTGAAVEATMGSLEQEIAERVAQEDQGFRGGWISSVRLDDMVRDQGLRVNRAMRAQILESMGYRQVCRSSRVVPQEGNARPVLWALETLTVGSSPVEEYMMAQGYVGAGGGRVMHMPPPAMRQG